jgi:hypothetical protein
MALVHSPKIITNGLRYFLHAGVTKSYPGTGTTWFDLAGGTNSTLVNSPTYSTADGGYFAFNGTNSYTRVTTTPTGLTGNINLTVMGFFRRTGTFTQRGVWGVGGDANLQGLNPWNFNNADEICIDAWGVSTFTTGTTYPLNQWVFCAWQKIAGPMNRSNCIIWRNMVSYTGTQLTVLRAESASSPNINSNGIFVGSINNSTTYCTPMQVGLIMFYNTILTPSEIEYNYNFYKSRYGL